MIPSNQGEELLFIQSSDRNFLALLYKMKIAEMFPKSPKSIILEAFVASGIMAPGFLKDAASLMICSMPSIG